MPQRPQQRCPRCRTLTPNSGLCTTCRRGPDPLNARAQWKWIYDDPRWKALRDQVLSEEPVCACGCGGVPTVVDHKEPHRGDEQLAFDRANCQAMTKPCHDRKTAAETLNAPAKGTVTVVLGPPCSGKTTYANTHAAPEDVVIDLDAIAQALTPDTTQTPATPPPPRLGRPLHTRMPTPTRQAPHPGTHGHTPGVVALANEARDAMIRRLARPHPAHHVWIVTTRHADAHRLPGAKVVLLDEADAGECKRRARAAGRPDHWNDLIDEWFIAHRARNSA